MSSPAALSRRFPIQHLPHAMVHQLTKNQTPRIQFQQTPHPCAARAPTQKSRNELKQTMHLHSLPIHLPSGPFQDHPPTAPPCRSPTLPLPCRLYLHIQQALHHHRLHPQHRSDFRPPCPPPSPSVAEAGAGGEMRVGGAVDGVGGEGSNDGTAGGAVPS